MPGPEAPSSLYGFCSIPFATRPGILWRIGWGDGLSRGRQSIRRGRHRCETSFKAGCQERGELAPITESGHPLRSQSQKSVLFGYVRKVQIYC